MARKTPRNAARKPYRVGRSRTGLGLFATAPIKNGAFIIAYRGRRIQSGIYVIPIDQVPLLGRITPDAGETIGL